MVNPEVELSILEINVPPFIMEISLVKNVLNFSKDDENLIEKVYQTFSIEALIKIKNEIELEKNVKNN